jgi:DNA/RNA endonuclease G (NUC1)
MKKIVMLLLLCITVVQFSIAQDYCIPGTTCSGNPCPFIQVKSGRSIAWDASKPINLTDHFQIQYLPAGILPNSSSALWFVTDQYGVTSSFRGDDPRATNYSFGSAPNTANQWGAVKVGIAYRCPATNVLMQSNDAKIEVLNYGIYFYNAPGVKWKFASGRAATMTGYLDRNKPTIIYVHGWNKGAAVNKSREELLDNAGNSMIQYWLNKGWNVGIYYWNQFSDEDVVTDAEKKIYTNTLPLANNINRWRQSDGQMRTNASPDSSMAKIFLSEYYPLKSFLLGNGKELRIAAHSLGSQLTLAAMAEVTPVSFLPDRIALLDPWWSLGVQSDVAASLNNLKDKNMPLEWYSTSKIQTYTSLLTNIRNQTGNLLGVVSKGAATRAVTVISTLLDNITQQVDYIGMINATAYADLTPTYDASITAINPVQSLTNQHNAAVWYYFTSINSAPPSEAQKVISSSDIRNYSYDDIDETNTLPFFYTSGEGLSASSDTRDIATKRGWQYTQIKGRNVLAANNHVQLATWGILAVPLNRAAMPFPQAEMEQVKTGGVPNGLSAPAARDDFRRVGTPVFLPGRQPANFVTRIVPSTANVNGRIWDSYQTTYNCDALQPAFVTWHLSQNWRANITQKQGRRNFITSKSCTNRVTDDDYRGSGMERGHLIPRSDRNYNVQENDSTFLAENMAPHVQQQNSKNAWRKLEAYLTNIMVGSSVRSSSTTQSIEGYNLEAWVVAGGAPPGYETITQGTTRTGTPLSNFTRTGKSYAIAVPNYIWKVILLHKPGTPFNAQTCTMIGVWLPNRFNALGSWDNPGLSNTYPYIVSVDEIENRTGIDFFNALPGDAGRTLESALEAVRFNPRNFLRLNGTVTGNSQAGRGPSFPDLIEEKACKQIVLEEGFIAPAGIRFRAYIDKTICTNPLRASALPAENEPLLLVDGLKLMPNPATNQVTVACTISKDIVPGKAKLKLTDITGRILVNREVAILKGLNQYQLDISQLKNGIYLVQLQTPKGEVWNVKLMKQ